MPLSEIHVVCRGFKGVTELDDGTFLSGSWVIDRDEIIEGKTIFFLHETTREHSYRQGVILEVREPTTANDRQQGRTDVVVRRAPGRFVWRGNHPPRHDGSPSREKAYLWENEAAENGTMSTSGQNVQRHDKILFEFLSGADDPISAGGTVIVREDEMYLEVDCPDDHPYSIHGRIRHGFWHGHHKGLPGDVPVEAKWGKLDDVFIGTWIENGIDYVFTFRLH